MSTTISTRLRTCACALVFVSVFTERKVAAQEVIRSIPDLWVSSLPVGSFAWIGDVTADGVTDFVVGDTFLSTGGLQFNGRVRVHSGDDASVLFTHDGDANELFLGFVVAGFGDLDGDGIPDYLGSADRPGLSSFVWSGADGSALRRIERFDAAEGLGDQDGDGIPEFLTSWGFAGGGGTVIYYEGLDERLRITAPPGAVSFGLGLACIGDVDGDGVDDFAVGAPGDSFKLICEPGEVLVYSGREAQNLYGIDRPGEASMFGHFLDSPGDFTGDGIPDLAIAAPDWGGNCLSGGGTGRITFHDGPTGNELGAFDLSELPVPVINRLGGFLTAPGDINGNGYGDLIATYISGVGQNRNHYLLAIDTGTREPIFVILPAYGRECSGYGENLRATGDVNSDGFLDFSVSVPCGLNHSRLDIISGAPRGVKSLGEPCGGDREGPAPRIGVSGQPIVGTDLRLYLSQVPPGQQATLLLGRSATFWGRFRLPLPLPSHDGCMLRVAPELRIPAVAHRIRPGEGVAEVAVPIPDDVTLVGTTFYAQWLLRSNRLVSNPRASDEPRPFPMRSHGTTRALAIRVQSPDVATQALVTDHLPQSPPVDDRGVPESLPGSLAPANSETDSSPRSRREHPR